jgi:hypothetical protein
LLVCLVDRLLPFGPLIIRLTGPTASALSSAATALGISLHQLADQPLTDDLTEPTTTSGAAFLAELAMMQQYGTREAVCERLNERSASESPKGNSRFLVAEVVEEDGLYGIVADLLYPDGDGWRPAIQSVE